MLWPDTRPFLCAQAVVGYRDQHGQYKREDRVPVWAKRVVEHFHDGQRIFDGTHALLLPKSD
jgi:hypothetical protein